MHSFIMQTRSNSEKPSCWSMNWNLMTVLFVAIRSLRAPTLNIMQFWQAHTLSSLRVLRGQVVTNSNIWNQKHKQLCTRQKWRRYMQRIEPYTQSIICNFGQQVRLSNKMHVRFVIISIILALGSGTVGARVPGITDFHYSVCRKWQSRVL